MSFVQTVSSLSLLAALTVVPHLAAAEDAPAPPSSEGAQVGVVPPAAEPATSDAANPVVTPPAQPEPAAEPEPDMQERCLETRRSIRERAMQTQDLQARGRLLQRMPECRPQPPAPPPTAPGPAADVPQGTPPLTAPRLGAEVVLGTGLGLAGVGVAWLIDGDSMGVILSGSLFGILGVATGVSVAGSFGNQHGSFWGSLLGTTAGFALGAVVTARAGTEAAPFALIGLPVLGGVVGFNLFRGYDRPEPGSRAAWVPVVNAGADRAVVGLAGQF